MNVLVTGGTGFVGAYIIRYLLKKGYKVKAIHRANSDFSLISDVKDKIEWFESDVNDTDGLNIACQNIDHVYHVAGLISFKKSEKSKMMHVNMEGTANIVNMCLSNNVKKLLYISSIAAIGRKTPENEIDESAVWEKSKYNSAYGLSKYLGEREVWRGQAEGLNVVITNPSMIIGGGFWDAGTARLFDKVYKGISFYPGGTNAFVDVRDVAEMSIQLMESDISGNRYIMSGGNMAYKEVLTQIAKAYSFKPPTIKAGKALLKTVMYADQLSTIITRKQPLFSSEMLHFMTEKFYYSNEKIKRTLNTDFRPLENTIEETARHYLESLEKNRRYAILPLPDSSSGKL
ncbi:MAG: SDR family NAD(P)-dependent oxidoreductase [Chitinophagaceae bacterium]|nr:MAG: SDR family NAD(P)-dependent oxidoreductase [Chitinophagaceae bacterium]